MNATNTHRTLILASGSAGVAAVAAMAILGTSTPGVAADPQEPVETTPITTGETVTETVPPTSPETSVATPPVSVTTPSGFATPH
ncbi:hypothetical protein BN978_05244 [Mycolicibacterium mageritense DSM 44476 = CIP 104973]|nr:hypothetical protein BN978_05244 [Mycolicibacterium mageritense DSM 44476 = CIP 104973]